MFVRILDDVIIEDIGDRDITALAWSARPLGGEISLERYAKSGRRATLPVITVDSGPPLVGGPIRHRLRLAVTECRYHGERRLGDAPVSWAGARIGVLVQRIRVRVLNVSARGCLLEGCDPPRVTQEAVLLEMGYRGRPLAATRESSGPDLITREPRDGATSPGLSGSAQSRRNLGRSLATRRMATRLLRHLSETKGNRRTVLGR